MSVWLTTPEVEEQGINLNACVSRIEQEARREIRKKVLALSPDGCGDNSCAFVKPKGMATNGGCQCLGRERHSAMSMVLQGIIQMTGGRLANDSSEEGEER